MKITLQSWKTAIQSPMTEAARRVLGRCSVEPAAREVGSPSRHYRGFVRALSVEDFCFLLFAFCFAARGQFSLDWSTIDGGGGTSTGGVYTVTGTIGQPDAGAMSGGSFTLQGGFWGVVAAVQTPGAPYLTVTRSNNAVIVSWPLPADGWVLEYTNALPQLSAPWPQLPPPYQTNGANLLFTEPVPGGNRFYRLHKP
jgi:hypothetical protein